jgi:ABC-2 type transport system ATP-binding protein
MSGQELANSCRRALQLTVGDAAAAAVTLETRLGIRDYKVVNAHELRIYSHLDESARVVQTLVAADIAVSGIAEVGDSLENFYTNLIEGKAR